MSRKKIFYIIPNLNVGGAEVHFLDLLVNTDKSKFKVYAVVPFFGFYLPVIQQYADEVIQLDFAKRTISLFYTLRKIIKKENPTIVYAHLVIGLLVTGIANLGLNNRFYCNLHGIFNEVSVGSKRKAALFRFITFIFQFNCHYIAVSESMKRNLMKSGILSKNITIIYNGINLEKFRFESVETNLHRAFNVVYIGRLHPEKGVDKILAIAKALQNENIQFQIIGDGPLMQEISERISSEKINNVKLLGYKLDIKPYLYGCDVLLMPSEYETFGLSILEAMACGKPIIASNTGGIPELLLNGEGGFLCEPNDIDCFVEKIKLLMQYPHIRTKFGAFNRKRFEMHFTIKQMMSKLEALYEA